MNSTAIIGGANYGTLGHVPPRLPTAYFVGSLQSRTNLDVLLHVVAYPVKTSIAQSAYSASTVDLLHEFRRTFVLPLNYFLLASCPGPLASHPGDAANRNCRSEDILLIGLCT